MHNQDEILKALFEINLGISILELDKLLELILKTALKLTQSEAGDIRLLDLDTSELVICKTEGKKVKDSLERISISYLFSIDTDAQLEDDLNKGNKGVIPKGLRNEFKTKKGISLSKNAFLEKKKDNKWNIVDGEETYVIKKEGKKLNIYPIKIGVTGWAVVGRKPIPVPDVTVDKRYVECIGGTKSELVVPMLYGDEVIGVLNVESDRVNAFDENHAKLLEALASQAAIAIENTRLIEQLRKEQIKQKNTLDVFYKIGAKITTKLELIPVLKEITRGVYKIVGADIPLIYLYDQEKGEFSEEVVFGDISEEWEKGCRPRSEDGTGKKAIESGRLFVIEDVEENPNILNKFPEQKGVKASAVLPLKFDDKPLGTLYLHFLEKHHFIDKEKTELDTLAKQAATIINKIGFNKEPKGKIAELKEKFAVDFEKIAKKIDEITKADILLIYLYNEEKNEFEDLIFAELSREWAIKCRPRPNGAGKKAIEEKELIIAGPDKEIDINPFPKRKGVKLTAAFPLMLEDKILGALYMHFLEEHHFTDDERRAIKMFGAHAATIMDMTNAYENLRRHSTMRKVLLDIGRDITSNLKIKEIGLNIAEGIAKITPECTLNLYLYHLDYPEDKRFEFVAGAGTKNEILLGQILPRSDGVGAHVVENVNKHIEPEYIIIGDVQDSKSGGSPSARDKGVKTTACFPLKFKEQVIGLLYLHFLETYHFTKEEIEAFILLSDQAAIAIENAKKLEDSEKKRGQTYEELFGTELLNCLEGLRGTVMKSQNKEVKK